MTLIRDNKLLSLLNRTYEAPFFSHLTSYSAAQGTILQRAGEPADYVYFPTSGMVSLLTIMKNGESLETGAVGYDGAVGYNSVLSGRNESRQTIVQLAMTSVRIARARFCDAFNRSAGLRHMVQLANEQIIAQAQQTAACHALHTAERRFARWLLQSHDYAGVDELEITQEFAAEMMGVRRTTVSLAAGNFQKRGLIRYIRGRVAIIDRPGLECLSCECYEAAEESAAGDITLKPFMPAIPASAPLPPSSNRKV